MIHAWFFFFISVNEVVWKGHLVWWVSKLRHPLVEYRKMQSSLFWGRVNSSIRSWWENGSHIAEQFKGGWCWLIICSHGSSTSTKPIISILLTTNHFCRKTLVFAFRASCLLLDQRVHNYSEPKPASLQFNGFHALFHSLPLPQSPPLLPNFQ